MIPVADDTTMDVTTRLGALRVRMCGSGPPAVLWHSLFVDSATWNRVCPRLGEHRRLILIDGPSHGSSAPTHHRFTLQDCADAASDVLDHLDVDVPVDWVGNAWGGHVGIAFAAGKPEQCRSLVTIGTPVRALNPAERRRIVPLVALYRILGPVRPLRKGVENALLGAKPASTDAHVISSALRGADRRGMYAAMRSVMLHRPDLTSVLAPLATPTLIVAAERDALWQPTEARAAAGHLPHRAFGTVPGAGHIAPLLQHAPALTELVSDFWQDPDTFSTRHRSLT
jgi:pimeloyl-ACP methyl ester carboxylesterase